MDVDDLTQLLIRCMKDGIGIWFTVECFGVMGDYQLQIDLIHSNLKDSDTICGAAEIGHMKSALSLLCSDRKVFASRSMKTNFQQTPMDERKDFVLKIVEILVEHWIKYSEMTTKLVIKQTVKQFPNAVMPASNKPKDIRLFQQQLGKWGGFPAPDSMPC